MAQPSPSVAECSRLDNLFGPHAGPCRGGFDFTLLFEETILTILPLGLMLVILPPRIWYLLGRTRKVTGKGNTLALVKMSCWITLAALQVAALVLWANTSSVFFTRSSLAAVSLSPISTLALCLLSYFEHSRTVKPSTLLNSFLFATLLFDIAHARTLWLRAEEYAILKNVQVIAVISVVAVAIKALVLVAEAYEKRRMLRKEYGSYPPEATGSVFNRSFFWWLNSLFRVGYRHVLDVDELFVLDKHIKSGYCHPRFQAAWAAVAKTSKSPHALLVASFGVVKRVLLQTIPPRACLTALNFCQPFLINRAIRLSQEPITHETTQIGYGLIGAYFFVYVGIAVTMGQYQHRTYRTISMIRAGLVSIIYSKTGSLSLKDVDPAASMTLMSADMERIVQGFQTMHEIWSNAIEVGVAIFLLEQQLGVACVVPVAVSILSLIGSIIAMNFIMSRQAMWLEAIEKRISATSAMLNSIKGVKMCGLKDTLLASLQQLRIDEMRISKKFRKLLIWNMTFAYLTQVFAPVLTFAIFSVRARNNSSGDEQTLDTARVFTALSLFALLSEPLASLVMSLAAFLGAVGSFARVQQFLKSPERQDMRLLPPSSSSPSSGSLSDYSDPHGDDSLPAGAYESKPKVHVDSAEHAISVSNASFGWDSAKAPILKDLSLHCPWGKLTTIVGPVGCGKSTLLHGLLGEIPILPGGSSDGEKTSSSIGTVRLGSLSVAYCPQNPWHMNGTVRDAIIGSSSATSSTGHAASIDEKWYARVINACALLPDLAQLPQGDESRIGSGGIALSGGQSQRIALARAVYARRRIIILDDVLSGLDLGTENHVFHALFGERGLCREVGSSVIVVSSSAKRLPYSDRVIVLNENGEMTGQGTYAELNNAGGYVSSFSLPRADWSAAEKQQLQFDNELNDSTKEKKQEKDLHQDMMISHGSTEHQEFAGEDSATQCSERRLSNSSRAPARAHDGVGGDLVDRASRSTGDIQIYLYYVKSVGWWASLLFVVAMIGFVFCMSFPNIWVQWWAAANERDPNGRLGYWLGVYAALGGAALVCLFLSCYQMIITMVPLSGEKFHFKLLKTVLNAPISFFVTTDSGITLNRFSQDLQLIDMELPISALNTFATFILCIAQMILIGVGTVYAAISFPIVLISLFVIQKIYLRTSRQLRLLDLETKAPLYSLFEESLSGLTSIRAFGWHHSLSEKNHMLLDRSQRPFYLLFAVQRWLTLVLDLLVAAVAVLLMVLIVQLRGTIAAGGVGLALLNIIQFSQNVKLLVTFWTNLETHIGSVARIKSFTENTPPEDINDDDKSLPPPEWPSAGGIEFTNLTATYRPNSTDKDDKETDLVLNKVSLSIKPGEKIGIVGRTGSGKTSLIMSLFRILDLQEGSISIDGIDIASLPRQEIRSRLVGVPQHPFLLKGSVRLNADPLGTTESDPYRDSEIRHALQAVQLLDIVDRHGGLDADVDELNLSSGQRQLFCLARAMLRRGNILVLDEATSSIDGKTEETIQRLIRRKFSNHTIIAVAHRLETIMDFDKVAVMERGKIIEFDSPYALLETPKSAFSKLYNAAMAEELDMDVEMD
ncbi:hypothetical protein QBC37DRAFT_60766 [Rhypophila decipiens]|uniref:Uncharacterized protein n=1 Tax=Rhypophila decipiens TaxID=261697 RepID=A0AAN6Y0C0_9PEZI|nr:hypothetical protein QBC37DRAFT_60766 [Rhypophila decipiens]